MGGLTRARCTKAVLPAGRGQAGRQTGMVGPGARVVRRGGRRRRRPSSGRPAKSIVPQRRPRRRRTCTQAQGLTLLIGEPNGWSRPGRQAKVGGGAGFGQTPPGAARARAGRVPGAVLGLAAARTGAGGPGGLQRAPRCSHCQQKHAQQPDDAAKLQDHAAMIGYGGAAARGDEGRVISRIRANPSAAASNGWRRYCCNILRMRSLAPGVQAATTAAASPRIRAAIWAPARARAPGTEVTRRGRPSASPAPALTHAEHPASQTNTLGNNIWDTGRLTACFETTAIMQSQHENHAAS
jgi:hypothetical protein